MENNGKLNTANSILNSENTEQNSADSRRPYARPQMISAEGLEAAAATCAPPTGGFGKQVPNACGTLGS